MSKSVSKHDKSSEVYSFYSSSHQLRLECIKVKASSQLQKNYKVCPLKPCKFKYKSKVDQNSSKVLDKLKKMPATVRYNIKKSTTNSTSSKNLKGCDSLFNKVSKLDAAAIELASLSIKTTAKNNNLKKFDYRHELSHSLSKDLSTKNLEEKIKQVNCKSNAFNEQINEAKVDHEGDYEVLDLTSMIENCLYFPKEMSVMAQAMYG